MPDRKEEIDVLKQGVFELAALKMGIRLAHRDFPEAIGALHDLIKGADPREFLAVLAVSDPFMTLAVVNMVELALLLVTTEELQEKLIADASRELSERGMAKGDVFGGFTNAN